MKLPVILTDSARSCARTIYSGIYPEVGIYPMLEFKELRPDRVRRDQYFRLVAQPLSEEARARLRRLAALHPRTL